LARLPAFIPAYEGVLVIVDVITAVMLFGQFVHLRSAALLALAAGYLYDGLIIVPHALTFPGLMSPTGWLGAGMHSTAWLYMFWHGGFPLFIMAYARLSRHADDTGAIRLAARHALWAIAAVVGVVALLTLLATAGESLLPTIMAGNTATGQEKIVVGVVWGLTAIGLVALLRNRPYSVLDLWLIVVMVAWLADIGLSAVLNAGRFDFGFYAGRIYGLFAASFVLGVLLVETGALHQRLAEASEQLRRQASELDARVRERTAELATTNRQFSAILESSPVAVFMLDPTGKVQMWTTAAERIFGYTREQALGRLPPYLIDERMEDFRVHLAETVASAGAELRACETQQQREDGAIIDVSVRAAKVTDEDGELLGVMYAVGDITDRKRLERQLHQAQKMEALGNLTGGLAHDFNNHLGVIILNLDILQEHVAGDAEAEELAQEAVDAANRGADLIRRLLAFARKQPLQPQRSDINKLVAETAKMLERLLGEQVRINIDLDPNVWSVVVDPAQLESSLTNLANNARDAMPNGGALRIATGNRQLDEDYAAEHAELAAGDYAMIEISDNGSGIPPEMIAKVFDPFFTTKPPGKGTGLGLSMVYGFMKQSGGHINVYSEVGAGTTIRLYLPRCDVATAADGTAALPAVARGGGETVLAVEDNPSLRRVVVRQLTEIGYRVIAAQSAPEALDLLEEEPVDVLFTDVVLPGGVSGYELAAQVSSRWPHTKLVLTSGFPDIRIIGKEKLENVKLLIKPYRRADIAAVVKTALEQPVG
jgi:PAS domain S-box-containing protein